LKLLYPDAKAGRTEKVDSRLVTYIREVLGSNHNQETDYTHASRGYPQEAYLTFRHDCFLPHALLRSLFAIHPTNRVTFWATDIYVSMRHIRV